MDTRTRSIRVLMLPWLAHGHISPFLELAKSLARRNFLIYICSSPVNLDSLRKKVSEKESVSIKLVDLHIHASPELPSRYHTTNGLPPHLMPALKKAVDRSRPEFANLLRIMKPDLVIYDFLQPWVPEESAMQNIPAVLFLCTGAASFSYFMNRCIEHPTSAPDYPFPAIDFRESESSKLLSLAKTTGVDGTSDLERSKDCVIRSCDIVLIKTFRELEGKYVDYLQSLARKKFVPVGPLVQIQETTDTKKDDCIAWLDTKDHKSTVFASFGSEYFLSRNEIDEIALGLELSGANFIWVVRFPDGQKSKPQEELPKGFLERVGERGMVLENWAPQAKILSHPGVGGFLSHCGWSSVMEGIHYCVPIIALPMHLDQPLNARLVGEVGVGEEVVRSEEGRVERKEVARVVKKVVEESGEKMRRRMRELNERGGEEMDGAERELVRLWRRKEGLNLREASSSVKMDFVCMNKMVTNQDG